MSSETLSFIYDKYSMMSSETLSFIYDQNASPPNERIPAPICKYVLTEIKKKKSHHNKMHHARTILCAVSYCIFDNRVNKPSKL